MALLENLASGIRYSSKTQIAGNIKDAEIFAIRMAQAVGTDLYPEIENVSPLTIPAGGVEAAYRYIEADMPIAPAPCTSMGGDAPVTMAGSTVLTTAMVMGWTVLTQLIKPGAAISFAAGSGPIDMRTGVSVMTPTDGIQTGMMNQMLRWYRIPVWINAGWASTSKKFDYQTGFEKTSGILASALTGGHLLLFQGGSAVELLYHPVLSIMDDEIAAWVGRYLQGVTVTDDTLAIDVINQVGPSPGHYLGTAHTREWWQKEHVFPKVRDALDYPTWIRTGKKDMLDLAKARMEEILATHKPTPLTSGQEQALEDILKEARECFRERGVIAEQDWATYMNTLQTGG